MKNNIVSIYDRMSLSEQIAIHERRREQEIKECLDRVAELNKKFDELMKQETEKCPRGE
jgi:flagellin-specific chaperone FliS